MRVPSLRLVLVCTLVLLVPRVGTAATFVVNATSDAVDSAPGDGVCDSGGAVCTLRAAIQEANALAGADAVTLPAGTYALTIPRLNDQGIARGDLDVTQALTITGAGAATTIVDGAAGLDRVFDVTSTVAISGITIQGGLNVDCGGGVRNTGTLTLTSVVVAGNDAFAGGGLCNSSSSLGSVTATLVDVRIENNTASGSGGGILNETTYAGPLPFDSTRATVTLTSSVVANNEALSGGGIASAATLGIAKVESAATAIRDNTAANDGGGVHISGTQSIGFPLRLSTFEAVDTTISGNSATSGGGIFGAPFALTRSTVSGNTATANGGGALGTGTLTDSTVSGNSANGNGGGLLGATDGFYTLRGVTITGNVADADNDGSGDGGGIVAPAAPSAGFAFSPVDLANTILAGNTDLGGEAPDCAGELRSSGHNLLGSATGCLLPPDATNVVGVPPSLGPLAANGGPTDTHALLPGSPALDGGAGCSATDQRGIARPQGAACDVGAVEAVQLPSNCGNGTVDGGEVCDDGNVRDGDCCNHLCQYEGGGSACSDGNPCTDDVCDGAGSCGHAANTAACTDGSVCTVGAETCGGGSCLPGAARDCSDGNACTSDVCHAQNGCQYPGLTGPACDDGNGCTASDACNNGQCKGTNTTDPCDDGNLCTDNDACENGHCAGIPNTDPCDDGNACTANDQCSNRSCVGSPFVCGLCELCDTAIGCTVSPRVDCRETDRPRNTALQVKNSASPKADSLQWTWQDTGPSDPDDVTAQGSYPDYELCVFDESAGTPSLVLGVRPPIGLCGTKECWQSKGGGARYNDPSGSTGGLTRIQTRRTLDRLKLDVKMKGANLALPPMPFAKDPGVVVQLRRLRGKCWTSRFENPTANTAEKFKSKAE